MASPEDPFDVMARVFAKETPPISQPRATVHYLKSNGTDSRYAQRALEAECERVASAQPGERNHTLNRAAFSLAQLVAGGVLDADDTEHALVLAGRQCGLDDTEIRRTLASGFKAGQEKPRGVPERPDPDTWLAGLTPPAPSPPALDDSTVQAAEDEFWAARPELDHLRTFARARMTSPWAVLGVALARVIVTIPPFYVLPPIVGSHASLNLFLALVGPSGGGKGAAENAAADALDLDTEVFTATVGSGEGIGHLYAHREKGEVIRDRDEVLFTIPEVDNLVALGSRQGATLMPQLRSAWSGEKLGFAYADKNKALPLDRHTYRMGLVLGVQPGRAGPLLDDADGGTPQRFLWLPTSDPHAPDELPPPPEPLRVRARRQPVRGGLDGLVNLHVCDTARNTIVDNRRARLRGDGNALDGHSLLCRLKTAAALALLDGRYEVDDHDWHLSGLVMTVSDHTRAGVVAYLAAENARANQARGLGEAERAVQVHEHVERAAVSRCARSIGRRLKCVPGDGWVTRGELRRSLRSTDRQHYEDAVQALLDAGQIESEDHDRSRLRATDRSPQ